VREDQFSQHNLWIGQAGHAQFGRRIGFGPGVIGGALAQLEQELALAEDAVDGPGQFDFGLDHRMVAVSRGQNVEDHSLHEEAGEISENACRKINEVRKNGGRIVAVGTTVTRLLETASDADGVLHEFTGPTSLYITPGYRFKAVDVLITNFHLPKTSLLALVAAFMGTERALEAYNFAIENRFRFYSFGDAMLIL
ncbi:MAG: S-adenosylmethionine:tRNA ribosyltransferase-isomerase, partial [bacterium]|nr:S-adenosylmethionine:tRNA ribosyltransferase-isomerase [bacterium]